jgi:outer membrane protein TolC
MHSRPIPLLVLCALAALAAGGPLESQLILTEEVNLADGLSAVEAVRLALRRNPELAALRKGRDAAEGAVSEAKAFSDPELRTGRLNLDDDWFRTGNYNIGVRWSPPRLGERGERGRKAQSRVAEIEADIAAAEQSLAAEVRLLHWQIVFLDEQVRLAEASLAVREQIVTFLDAQVEAGTKSLLDRTLAELALADARSLPSTYRLERQLCLARLRSKLGLPPGLALTLEVAGEPLAFQPRSLEPDGLLEKALAARPELAGLSACCEQAASTLHLRKRERYPWFSFLQVNREFGLHGAPETWGFRFGIDLPVFKWRQGMIRGPQAEIERCRLELDTAKRRIGLEVEELVLRLRERAAELELYRQSVAPLLTRDIQLAEQAVAEGQADLLERLSAEARQISRQQAYLSKLLDCRRLEIELDRALGQAIGNAAEMASGSD